MSRSHFVTIGLAALAALSACSGGDPEDDLHNIRRWEDTRTCTDSLAHQLRSGSAVVRPVAARAMGRIGDPAAVGPLTAAMREDSRAEVRREAAFALGILGDKDALVALTARLEAEEDLEATAQCALAIARIGHEGSATFLLPLLDSPHPRLREAACEGLALLADSTSTVALIAATDDPVESVAWRAAYALEKIPGEAQVPRLMGLSSSSSVWLRCVAVRSLGRLEAKRAVGRLAEMCESESSAPLRIRLADALGRIGETTPPVFDAMRSLLADPDFGVRTAALTATARLEARELLPEILDLREDPSVDVRAAAYEAAGACLDGRSLDVLRPGLEDSSAIVVQTCLRQIGESRDDESLAMLVAVFDTANTLATRLAAIEGLAAAGERAPVTALRGALNDPSPFVASVAVRALAADPSEETLVAILEACERPDDASGDLRLAAFESLGAHADARAIPVLRKTLDESGDLRLRVTARDALEEILDPSAAALLPEHDELLAEVRPHVRSTAQPPVVTRSDARQLILQTDRGRIVIDLFGDDAPQMVESFARLAESGFFDGLNFHRVVPDFVIQGGDPTGTGWGDAGYTLRSEWSPRSYERGTVGIAHSGKDTGSCQLFVAKSPQLHLDAHYTIFGEVVIGMEVVDQIQRGDRMRVEVVRESSGSSDSR